MAAEQPDATPQAKEALRLAGLGFKVFPCHGIDPRSRRCTCGNARCKSPGKHPRTDNGCTGATRDLAVVAAWWRQWPGANVAVATGLYGGGKHLLVLDNDPRHGGDESLAALEQRHGRLPETTETLSGGSGRHLWLWSAEEVKNSAGQLGPGLDVRGTGGYVLVPPSEHQSGQRYRWEIDHALGEHPTAPAPAWLLDLIRERKRAPRPAAEAEVQVIEGGRNLYLTKLAGAARRQGSGYEELLALLVTTNRLRCVPPLDEAEVQVIAKSVSRYAPGEAWKASAQNDQGQPAAQPAEPGEWQSVLIRRKGEVTSDLANLLAILEHDERWAGRLRLNDARAQIEVLDGQTWRRWSDVDDTHAAVWLQRQWGLRARPESVCQVVAAVATGQRCNPLATWLDGLVWDGVPRLETWLVRYCAAADTAYTRAVGAAWLRAAVARALCPGVKVDAALILEGAQGAGKSSVLAIIGGDYFTDDVRDLGHKDAVGEIARSWIVELAELSSLARSEVEMIKAFLSRQVDRVRPPYGRAPVDLPRRCIFGGSTNRRDYLRDDTGNRRFWPVAVGAADLPALLADREQLLAEAVAGWHELGLPGTRLPSELWETAKEEQEARAESDPWEELVAEQLDKVPGDITLGDLLQRMGIEVERQDDRQARRVVRLLQRYGWLRRQVRRAGRRVWVYERPPEVAPVPPDDGEDR